MSTQRRAGPLAADVTHTGIASITNLTGAVMLRATEITATVYRVSSI